MKDRMRCSKGDGVHIRNFLRMISLGLEDDFGTPILGSDYRTAGVDLDRLRKLAGDNLQSMCGLDRQERGDSWMSESLIDAEVRSRLRQGSGSRRTPYQVSATSGDSLYDQVEVVRTKHKVVLNQEAADVADAFVAKYYSAGRKRLRLASLPQAAFSFHGNKSVGYPRFVANRDLMRPYLEETLKVAEAGWPLDYAATTPSMMGIRSVPRGPYSYSRTRFISQWSRLLGVPEKMPFLTLMEEFKQYPTFCAWHSPLRVNQCMTAFMKCAPGQILSMDFTQFDATVDFDVIRHVYAIMKNWFESDARPLFNFLETGFIYSGLMCPQPHNTVQRLRGIPSGSVMTNFVGSLVNIWVMAYCAHLCGGSILAVMVQGDDGVYAFQGITDFAALSRCLQDELGMTMKMDPAKNLVSSVEVQYLQNYHRKDVISRGLYVGVRPIHRAGQGMFMHEHAPSQKKSSDIKWSAKYNTYRLLQQMNNCADHPRFDRMCLWGWKYDEYIKESVGKIIREDPEVSIANMLLDVGNGERGKLPVKELRWSPVVLKLIEIARKMRVSL